MNVLQWPNTRSFIKPRKGTYFRAFGPLQRPDRVKVAKCAHGRGKKHGNAEQTNEITLM